MEKITVNKESLAIAIQEFNDWSSSARIYLDLTDGEVETAVYLNDVNMVETFSSDDFVVIYSKRESYGYYISEKRKPYFEELCNMILDGYAPYEARYILA